MWIQIHTGLYLTILVTVLHGIKGEDYLVAAAYQGEDAYIRYTTGETWGLVDIQYPHLTDRGVDLMLPFTRRSHRVNAKMKIKSVIENAAIVVSGSDEDINIVVDGDGVFSPLPISALGTKYILPSSLAPDSRHRSLLLIATHNMSTTVHVFFRMNRGTITFASYNYSDGDVLSLKINPYQTLKMSTPYDLNGTVITSEHSIAVYSGMEYDFKYTVYDQLLPVKHYGQEYVVAVEDLKLGLQIISEHSNVQITFSSGATVSTGERRLYNRSLERGESLHFTATRPVLVTLSRADGYNSAFTTVPPVHSYVTHTGVLVFGGNLNTTLKVLTDRRATVLSRYKDVDDLLTWSDIAGSRYKVGTLVQSLSERIYSTSISSDLPFTVLSFYNGSVYSVGFKLPVEEPVHYTGPRYLMVLIGNSSSFLRSPFILASAGETGGQWQVQDPRTGRVWSRRFGPHNTDLFSPNTTTTSIMLVHVRDDAVQIKGGMNIYTSFSPLPVSALGTKYIMSSCLSTTDTISYISVMVIATHDKMADVDIVFRLDGHVTYDNKIYIDGDTLSIRLDRYQTFSLNSSSDMTRTIVNAIAVYSGTYDVRETTFTTFEQLLPVKHYGHEYILAIQDGNYYYRMRGSVTPYQLLVVTGHSDTSIMFNNGSSISMGEDGVYRKKFGNAETFYFNTTRPVMVTMCRSMTSHYQDGMAVVPPVSLYSKLISQPQLGRGNVQILTDQENNNVDVQQSHSSFSSVFGPPVKWKNVSGTRFKVGTLRGGGYTTTISSNFSFAVLGPGTYAIYNGGYRFRTHPDTVTSKPDGAERASTTNSSSHCQAGSSNNAAMIVGVVCGIVVVALLFAFLAYVFYVRRKMLPDKEDTKPTDDIPSPSYFTAPVVDEVVQGEQSDGVYTELS